MAKTSRREKDLVELLKLTPEEAEDLAKGMRIAAGDPKKVDELLEKVNERIGGFGVEAIDGDGPGGYYMSVVLLYVNRGDTYDTTLLYQTDTATFHIGSWGDWVERYGERYAVQ